MYTILHISDLHRRAEDPASNGELLSSLVADFQRSARENPSVTKPDAIVVSGDLAEGLPLESAEYPDGLRKQYQEAADLIVSLSNEFLDGDRSRVVIVPGNHDVDWNGARKTFEIVDQEAGDPRSPMKDTETTLRWSWSNRKIFRIVDMEGYLRRFEYFSDMYRAFYQDAGLAHPVDPEKPWNLFELDDGNIIVCAFNSCVVNDCFSDLGYISSASLVLQRRFIEKTLLLPVIS